MFMASSVLSRVDNGAHAAVVGKLLTSYAEKLQRPDGLFIHAVDGPHAWGRGNGFALLGRDRSAHAPARRTGADRPRVLEIYRKHVDGAGEATSRMTAAGGRSSTSRRVTASSP